MPAGATAFKCGGCSEEFATAEALDSHKAIGHKPDPLPEQGKARTAKGSRPDLSNLPYTRRALELGLGGEWLENRYGKSQRHGKARPRCYNCGHPSHIRRVCASNIVAGGGACICDEYQPDMEYGEMRRGGGGKAAACPDCGGTEFTKTDKGFQKCGGCGEVWKNVPGVQGKADSCNNCGHSDGNHTTGADEATRFGEGPCSVCTCKSFRPSSDAYSGKSNDEVYEKVTARIIAVLEKGAVPWRKPWSAAGGGFALPRNLVTNKAYRGANVFILASSDYTSPFWATIKQLNELGGHVRKGEKATPIMFWAKLERDEENAEGETETKSFMFARLYFVFNLEQTEGVELPKHAIPVKMTVEERKFKAIEAAQAVLDNYPKKPPITNDGGDKAYYIPSRDEIHLPKPESFVDDEHYYTTAFHEAIHSTGHKSRLDRGNNEPIVFGSKNYGKEELVAEMGSAFLAGTVGIDAAKDERDTPAYVANWLKVLKDDRQFLISAASQGQKAADHILGTKPDEHATEKPKAAKPRGPGVPHSTFVSAAKSCSCGLGIRNDADFEAHLKRMEEKGSKKSHILIESVKGKAGSVHVYVMLYGDGQVYGATRESWGRNTDGGPRSYWQQFFSELSNGGGGSWQLIEADVPEELAADLENPRSELNLYGDGYPARNAIFAADPSAKARTSYAMGGTGHMEPSNDEDGKATHMTTNGKARDEEEADESTVIVRGTYGIVYGDTEEAADEDERGWIGADGQNYPHGNDVGEQITKPGHPWAEGRKAAARPITRAEVAAEVDDASKIDDAWAARIAIQVLDIIGTPDSGQSWPSYYGADASQDYRSGDSETHAAHCSGGPERIRDRVDYYVANYRSAQNAQYGKAEAHFSHSEKWQKQARAAAKNLAAKHSLRELRSQQFQNNEELDRYSRGGFETLILDAQKRAMIIAAAVGARADAHPNESEGPRYWRDHQGRLMMSPEGKAGDTTMQTEGKACASGPDCDENVCNCTSDEKAGKAPTDGKAATRSQTLGFIGDLSIRSSQAISAYGRAILDGRTPDARINIRAMEQVLSDMKDFGAPWGFPYDGKANDEDIFLPDPSSVYGVLRQGNHDVFIGKAARPKLRSVRIVMQGDESPDASYLEQEGLGFEERLAAYRNGDFGFVGIWAEAEVAVSTPQGGYGPIQRIRSGGLWGIEDDSDNAYLREVASEELSALRDELKAYGVTVPKRLVASSDFGEVTQGKADDEVAGKNAPLYIRRGPSGSWRLEEKDGALVSGASAENKFSLYEYASTLNAEVIEEGKARNPLVRDEAAERNRCTQCGDPMNPAERMLGPVCGTCTRQNHYRVSGGKFRTRLDRDHYEVRTNDGRFSDTQSISRSARVEAVRRRDGEPSPTVAPGHGFEGTVGGKFRTVIGHGPHGRIYAIRNDDGTFSNIELEERTARAEAIRHRDGEPSPHVAPGHGFEGTSGKQSVVCAECGGFNASDSSPYCAQCRRDMGTGKAEYANVEAMPESVRDWQKCHVADCTRVHPLKKDEASRIWYCRKHHDEHVARNRAAWEADKAKRGKAEEGKAMDCPECGCPASEHGADGCRNCGECNAPRMHRIGKADDEPEGVQDHDPQPIVKEKPKPTRINFGKVDAYDADSMQVGEDFEGKGFHVVFAKPAGGKAEDAALEFCGLIFPPDKFTVKQAGKAARDFAKEHDLEDPVKE